MTINQQNNYLNRTLFLQTKLFNFPFKQYFDILHSLRNYNDAIIKSYTQFNISHEALFIIENQKLNLSMFFAVPDILLKHQYLITYYRSICFIPQKGMQKMGFKNIREHELGLKKINIKDANEYSFLFNDFMNNIIESKPSINETDLFMYLYSSIGTQLDGSWRNQIGDNAEIEVIKNIISNYYLKNKIDSLISIKNQLISFKNLPNPELFQGNTKKYKGILLTNKYKILFSSEPDISILNHKDDIIATIEVKGGNDQAGSLERYGAAKKSFAKIKEKNSNCTTFLLTNTVSKETLIRLENDDLFDFHFTIFETNPNFNQYNNFFSKLDDILSLESII